ncbi:MAG: N-alpha-acetyl-L-2,4-diaminobutyric acid deacetylase [Acidimicrobiaceae bacterium]|nr:N-alpha-acetyl-L-2,4-diaminobutyric acid deacetylase [Acidimicrobiaceae bacterium]
MQTQLTNGSAAASMVWTTTDSTPIPCTVDLDGTGKAVGHFAVPWSRNESGWGNLLTPIAIIANGDGPTVLLTGGNHGDEFEGPVVLRRLIHELEASDIQGRVIIVPGLNHAAVRVGRRLSPIDNGNLNRLFPGNPTGTPTERVADFVYRELVMRSDLVLDFHSGGESMVFHPMIATHQLRDSAQASRTAEFIEMFGAPLAVIAEEPDPVGLLDSAVEDLGKIFLTTELWGGRSVSARTLAIADRGVRNTLRHAGILAGEPDPVEPPQFAHMVQHGTCVSPQAGLFEPMVDPGEEAAAGDLVARVHPLDDLSQTPAELRAGVDGIVAMRHNPGLIEAGDPAVTVAVLETAPWATP